MKLKNIFLQGPITPSFVGDSIGRHASKKNIGAHDLFLGQVRADEIDGKVVAAIEYTAYEQMALEKMNDIREAAFSRHDLTCLHVHHSLGEVKAGEISLFVFASAAHRKAAMDGCREVVEAIKKELPVWGKELFSEQGYHWKENS